MKNISKQYTIQCNLQIQLRYSIASNQFLIIIIKTSNQNIVPPFKMLNKIANRIVSRSLISARQTLKLKPNIYSNYQIYYQSSNSNQDNKQRTHEGIKVDQNFKQESKQFYNQQIQKIIQLKKSSDLNTILASSKQFVILDLYADWCAPCKILTPRLEKKVNSIDNAKLVKINIDTCPQVAQALKITTVPTVYLVHMSQPLQKFEGNVKEYQFDKFFQMINKVKEFNPQISKTLNALQNARELLVQGQKAEEAAKILEEIANVPINPEMNAFKSLLLCRCYFQLEKVSKFKDQFTKVEARYNDFSSRKQLVQLYNNIKLDAKKLDQLLKSDPQISKLNQKIINSKTTQQKLQAKFELVNYYKNQDMMENALQLAMEIVKEEKYWEEKKTNRLILTIFKELGETSPLVHKYRRMLQRILY